MKYSLFWLRISSVLTLFILLLIPTARTLEHGASSLLQVEPLFKPILLGLASIVALSGAYRYIQVIFSRRTRQSAWLLLLALLTTLTLAATRTLVPIELFHIVIYGTLGLSLYFTFEPAESHTKTIVLALLLTTGVGVLDEGLQWIHPERVGDLRDVLLNSLSAAFGVLCAFGVRENEKEDSLVT
jgi:hypothetical protein